jgi:hypothetical protein
MMKPPLTPEAISKSGRLETISPNELRNLTWGNLRGGRPSVTGSGWPAQSGRRLLRGYDESAFMKSQLG